MEDLNRDRWRILGPHLDHALELDADEQLAWLESLDREAPDVAAQIRELLARREQTGFASFLAGTAAPAIPDIPTDALAGRRVGAYILESMLGRGGMGSVWLARRADGQYEGKAAIKFLYAAWSGDDGERRFRREGQLLARLDHPNIARLLDAGLADDSQPYLVLEYVQGERIDHWCDARRLDVRERIRVFLEVAKAVAHAHSHLVVHRDLKPANILVSQDGIPKLLDFGIGKLVGDEGGPALTRAGNLAMTPEYAAPEQLRGEPVTTATDVHALGLVLYELLTGRPAYGAARSSSSSMDLMRAVLENDAPRASAAVTVTTLAASEIASRRASTLGALRRTLQGDLDKILAKALRNDPSERYASVGAFAEDLRRYLEHEPVTARAASARYRAAKFVRKHRAGFASGVLLMLMLVVATSVTTTQMVEARRQRDEAVFHARRAESANEFLNALLQTEGAPGQPPRSSTERLELGVLILESQYGDDPRFAGGMLVQLGRQFRGNAATDRSVEVFERAFELGRTSDDLELMALARCAAAYAEALAGVVERAAGRIVEAKRLIEAVEEPSVALRADCLQAEGVLADRSGDSATGIARLTDARRLLEQSGETHRAAYTSVLTDIGGVYLYSNRLAEALAMTELVGATHEKYGRGGTTARLTTLQNQATVLDGLGELREELELRDTAMRRARELEGEGMPSLSNTVNRAGALLDLARPQDALNALGDIVTTLRASGNQNWLTRALYTRGWAYAQLGDSDQAEGALAEAAQIAARNPTGNREILTRIDFRRAEVALIRGNVADARRHIDAAFATDGYPDTPATRATRELLTVAAETALRERQFDAAASHAAAALAIAESVARREDSSAHVGEALLLLVRARQGLGEGGQRPQLERAVRCLTNGYGTEHPRTRQARELLDSLTDRTL